VNEALAVFGIVVAVLAFRWVRLQYGPMLAAQPTVTNGPGRVAFLGIGGVFLTLLGLASAELGDGLAQLGAVSALLLVPFGIVTGAGGIVLAGGALAYYRYSRITNERTVIPGGRNYIVREFALTVAPWIVFGLTVSWEVFLVRAFDSRVACGLCAAAALWIAAFQFSPHVLARRKMPEPELGLARDGLAAFALAWPIVAASRWSFDIGYQRVIMFLPAVLAVFGAIALKMREKDLY
jgi:hypothetical protein